MAKEFSLQVKAGNFAGDKLTKQIQKAFQEAIEKLAQAALEHAKDEARQKLHSQQDEYIKNLKIDVQNNGKSSKIKIFLDKSAQWIEDGHKEIDLKDKQLKGRSSLVIPFKHGKTGPEASTNPTKQVLYNESKDFLKSQGLKVSKSNFGQSMRQNQSFSQVPSSVQSKHSGESVLNRMKLGQDVGPRGGTKNQMTTFRTMSKDQPKDMWVIPASKGVKILDSTKDWLDKNYKSILNDLLKGKK